MDQATKAKEKVKEPSEALKYYKGFELLCRWTMKHHNQTVDFSNLDFETIDIEILVDKVEEQEEVTVATAVAEAAGRDDATDPRQINQGHEDEAIIAP
nr:hypothetical protein CFP56_78606 [Quercus suber]